MSEGADHRAAETASVRPETSGALEESSSTVQQTLTFPNAPRLELDQLLEQLVARAQEVIGTQGRLRGRLKAQQRSNSALGVKALLRRIVEASRELIGARYAALGVISPEGTLEEFSHAGMPSAQAERIGHLPKGHGLLGALI